MNKKILSSVIIGLSFLGGQAVAQQAPLPQGSGGEVSPIQVCFYECKPVSGRTDAWQEVTTLMLTNQSPNLLVAQLTIMDGKQNPIARTNTLLSSLDLDEINICRTLRAAGIPAVLSAGLVEIEFISQGAYAPLGGYAWIKNLVGKFFVTVDEPFQGMVTGIAKTECRVVPPEVSAGHPSAPEISPVLIENTQDN